MKKTLVSLLALLFVLSVVLAGCGGGNETEGEEPHGTQTEDVNTTDGEDGEEGEEVTVPDEIQEFADEVLGYAGKFAKELDGDWGDMHAAMMEADDPEEYAEFDTLREALVEFLEESDAKYIYAMYPSDTDNLKAAFMITIDGSEDVDKFGTKYDNEKAFVTAWEGKAAVATNAWEDKKDGGYCWSAYAPILNSDDEVVAILGVDCPASIIEDFPEWNIDSDEWNKLTEWKEKSNSLT